VSEPASSMLAMGLDSPVELVGAYGLLTVVGLVVAKAMQLAVLGWLEPEAVGAAPPAKGAAKKRLRAEAVTEDLDLAGLALGKLPSPDHHAHVAYLRGGVPSVAELLVVRAEAEGWLAELDSGGLRVGEPDRWASSLTRELRAKIVVSELGRSGVLGAARAVAERHAEGFERDLVATGLLRNGGARTAGSLVATVIGLGVAGAVLMRASLEAELGRAHLPLAGVFFAALLGTGFVARTGRLTSAGERYLGWLVGATEALRADVASGQATAPDDVALAVAVDPLPAFAGATTD
jgi:uncharacterized protein (TIGR04222 family)